MERSGYIVLQSQNKSTDIINSCNTTTNSTSQKIQTTHTYNSCLRKRDHDFNIPNETDSDDILYSSLTAPLDARLDDDTLIYRDESKRRKTFDVAPHKLYRIKDQLIKDGFYYEGQNDTVKCYACGFSSKNWTSEHPPMTKHVKEKPQCRHLLYKRQETLRNHQPESVTIVNTHAKIESQTVASTNLQSDTTVNNMKRWSWKTDEAVLAVLSLGFQKKLVEKVAFFLKIKSVLQQLREANRRLRARCVCTLCETRVSNLLLLPCKHLTTCEACGEAVTDCPLCDSNILATVKVYFG